MKFFGKSMSRKLLVIASEESIESALEGYSPTFRQLPSRALGISSMIASFIKRAQRNRCNKYHLGPETDYYETVVNIFFFRFF